VNLIDKGFSLNVVNPH